MKTKIYDPASPTTPLEILDLNFDPTKHTRWAFRPAVEPIVWSTVVVVNTDGSPGGLTDEVAMKLAERFPTMKDVVAGRMSEVDGVGARTEQAIQEWARDHPAYADAMAELAELGASDEPSDDEPSDDEPSDDEPF